MKQRVGDRWTEFFAGRRHRRPYAECPNCERHEYTTFQTMGFLFLSGKEWNECRNCHYSPDHPNKR